MGRAYSLNLRERVVAAVAAGKSCRAAAATFKISIASVVKWSQRFRKTGSAAAKPMGGNRPYALASERDWLLKRIAERPDITIRALLAALEGSGFDPEVILVDDGSTDGSAEVARSAVDGRVRLHVRAQPNRGRAANHAADGLIGRAEYTIVLLGVTIGLSLLMVSNVRFRSFKDLRFDTGTVLLVLFVIASSVFVWRRFRPEFVLIWLLSVYLIIGMVETLRVIAERLTRRERGLRPRTCPQFAAARPRWWAAIR